MRTKTHKQLKLQIPKFNKETLRLLNTPVCSKKITTLVIPPHTRRLYLAYYTASTDPRADEKTFVAFLLMPEYVDPESNDTDATRYFLRRLAGTAPFHWRFEREYVPVRPPHLNALVFLTTVPSDMFEGSLMTLISEVPINQGVVEYWVSNWVADVLSVRVTSAVCCFIC